MSADGSIVNIGLLGRAGAVWLLFVVSAIINGMARALFVTPYLGDSTSDAIGAIMESIVVVLIAIVFVRTFHITRSAQAWVIGIFWVALTIAVGLFAGPRTPEGPWREVAAEYDPWSGGWQLLVLVTLGTAPWLAGRLRAFMQASN